MEAGLDDQATFLEANKRFHDIIAWSSDNALFGYLVDALADILDGTMLGIDYPAHRRTAILRAHRNILDALERKDPECGRGNYGQAHRRVCALCREEIPRRPYPAGRVELLTITPPG